MIEFKGLKELKGLGKNFTQFSLFLSHIIKLTQTYNEYSKVLSVLSLCLENTKFCTNICFSHSLVPSTLMLISTFAF